MRLRTATRLALVLAMTFSILGGALATGANATPVCATTPSGTTCVDPTGSCLIAFYPRFGPAMCLRNPIQT